MTHFLERITNSEKKDCVNFRKNRRGKKEDFEEERGNGEIL